jgi:autotransporter-associated beta strand protein/T5SS/PEP-CTERM-associated repeat protein
VYRPWAAVSHRRRLVRVLALAAACVAPVGDAHAQTKTWIGGVGSFLDGQNWAGGQVPNGGDSIVVANGGTVQSSGLIQIAGVSLGGSGGTGTLEVQPGILSNFLVSQTFIVGDAGAGSLIAGSESLVDAGDFYVGYAAGVTGSVSLSGAYLSPFSTYLGYGGTASVGLANGSTLQSTFGYVGYLPGSLGVVNLTNSTWKAEDQGLPVDMTIGVAGRGVVACGTSLLSARNLVLSSSAGSSSVLSVSGGTVTVQNDLRVGLSGTAALSLTNSGSLTSYGASIGVLAGASGTASITDSSWTTNQGVAVGLAGNGTLQTSNAVFRAHDLDVGKDVGSTGTATFSGGRAEITAEIHVGPHGVGTLTLDGGGLLLSDKGDMGFAAGSIGTVNVTSGTWANTQAIFVGVSGSGALNIGGQGVVQSESGYIGQNASGVGAVSVTGGSWAMTNTLAVGVNGSGTFSATAGGAVSSAWGQVGLNAGSTGAVSLDNASWTIGNTLTIGSSANGQMTLANNATVAANAIQLTASGGVTGSLGVVNSSVSTNTIIAGGGTASVSFSGAQVKLRGGSSVLDTLLIYGFSPGTVTVGAGGLTIDTQGGNAQIASVLSGAGAVTKTGAGRLRLDATNTFTGGTRIDGGAVEIAGSGALGTGTTTLGGGEIRAIADVTLSNANPGSPPALAVTGTQLGTLSASSGVVFTVAVPNVALGNGSVLRFGSAGNAGNVVFAPNAVTLSSSVPQVVVAAGTATAGNATLAQVTAAAGSTTVAAGATLAFQDQLSVGGINALFGAGVVNTGTSFATSLVVNSGSFSGNISGNGQLVKASSGTLVLAGQNAFIGGTRIDEGVLRVDGDLAFGLGAVEVNAGGMLSGTGIVGTITLTGGTVAPGSSPGTLSAQNLAWTNGGLLFDLGPTQAASDQLLLSGGLQGFGATYPFTFVNQGMVVGVPYALINSFTSNIPIGDFQYTNGGGFSGTFSYSGPLLQFTVTAVPEPGAGAFAGAAGIIAWLLRRRRRRVGNLG